MKKIFIILFLTIFCFQSKASEATDWLKELAKVVYSPHKVELVKEFPEYQTCSFFIKDMPADIANFYFIRWLATSGFIDDIESLKRIPEIDSYDFANAARYENLKVCYVIKEFPEGSLVLIFMNN